MLRKGFLIGLVLAFMLALPLIFCGDAWAEGGAHRTGGGGGTKAGTSGR